MLTTTFCIYWDFYWDWGLFRGTQKGNRILRDEIKYSPKFYYFAMVTNVILRFWWVLNMAVFKFSGSAAFLQGIQIMIFISMMMEAMRRTIWSLIRVENELVNNFEKYRTYISIPPLKEDYNAE